MMMQQSRSYFSFLFCITIHQQVFPLINLLLFVLKQAEKAKQDEKEVKKLQENVQSLQLRLAAREHICKNLQEKVQIFVDH